MQIEETELNGLLESIRQVYGYDFTDYARASIKRRVINFMQNRQIAKFSEFAECIMTSEHQFEEFVQHVSVTVTAMFRDPRFFKSLRKIVRKRLATYPFIKVWIAGCATGEEVYSTAILLYEEGLLHRSVIYATDINQHSLQRAKEGIYPVDNMKNYTDNYQKSGGERSFSDYYKSKYNAVMFDRSLKQNIVFSPHNLTADKSFNEFQLIICRNVLIYFNQELQSKVINLFHESLCPFGILALGNKESLLFSDKQNCFADVDRTEKIFMKTL